MPLNRVKSAKSIYRMLEEAVETYEIDTNPENFQELTFEYQKLLLQDKENTWQRADLARLAASTYGKLKLLAQETGESYQMLKQLSYISKQYDKRTRGQFYKLNFSHFRVVAHLEERYALLQKAQDNGWTVDRLNQEVHHSVPEYVSLRKIVRTLNKTPRSKFYQMDAMDLLNLALGTAGRVKWNGKKFELERI